MSDTHRTVKVQGDLIGSLWFIGWRFTIAYANLVWWQVLFAVVIWPWYLGNAVG